MTTRKPRRRANDQHGVGLHRDGPEASRTHTPPPPLAPPGHARPDGPLRPSRTVEFPADLEPLRTSSTLRTLRALAGPSSDGPSFPAGSCPGATVDGEERTVPHLERADAVGRHANGTREGGTTSDRNLAMNAVTTPTSDSPTSLAHRSSQFAPFDFGSTLQHRPARRLGHRGARGPLLRISRTQLAGST